MKAIYPKKDVLTEKTVAQKPIVKDHEGLTITIASLKSIGFRDNSKEVVELLTMIDNLKK
jgi:hypothetical protein